MRNIVLSCVGVSVLASAAAWAQPAIRAENGVLNASSYAADIARGSWLVVFGTGMGPASLAVHAGGLPYPTVLSGTSVTFTPAAGGAAVNAMLWYTSAGQLAALLPSSAQAGDYDVRVIYNGQTSAARRVRVVERNFGFATQAQNGSGPAQATYGGADLNRFTTGTLGQFSVRPARPGDTMVLWGTGLGPDAGSDQTGATSGDQTAAGQVRVIVGGIETTPLYAGRSSGAPGLDQINFTVPPSIAPGCFVSLQVRAGGRTSNAGSIAVAPAGQAACSHPTMTHAQLGRLDQGGSVVVGSVGLAKAASRTAVPGFGSFDSMTESAYGSFGRYTVDAVGSAEFSMMQVGECYVFRRMGTSDQLSQGRPPVALDAGAQLTLNGPNASNRAIAREANSRTYSSILYNSGFQGFGASGSPTLTQGTYTIAGTGGADIGAFTARLDLPGNFVWSNSDSITDPIRRSADLRITWTGGGDGLVSISGMGGSQMGGSQQNPIFDATIFNCIAPASAGSFNVPASVLQQLPAVSGGVTGSAYGLLTVYAAPDASKGQGVFTAPLTGGGSIDQGFFFYSIGSSKTTGWN